MRRNIKFNLEKLTDFIESYSNMNGYPPSYREMKDFLNIQSTSTISYYLKKLEENGIITLNSYKNRSLVLNNKFHIYEIINPFYFNIFADENVIGKYQLPPMLNINCDCFLWKATESTEIYNKNDMLIFAIKNAKIDDFIMVNQEEKPFIKKISNIHEKYIAVLLGIYRQLNLKKSRQ